MSKPIIGYEGIYSVTEDGRILSHKRTDLNGHIRKEKFLKPTENSLGYLYVSLYSNGKMKIYKIHRLVAKAFIKNSDNKKEVNHIDGNKKNNTVENLEWCTRSENIQHSYVKALRKCKISESTIKSIKNEIGTQKEIADKYGISQSYVSAIRLGIKRKHIIEEEK